MTSAVIILNHVGVCIIPLLPLVCIILNTLADQESDASSVGFFLSALSSSIIYQLAASEGGKKEIHFPSPSIHTTERQFTHSMRFTFHYKHLLVH